MNPPRPSRKRQRLARFARLPVHLYDWGLGWLLGGRFLLLEHVGRVSGRRYRTVLEVVRLDRDTGEVFACAGFGPRTDWYRNVTAPEAAPEVTVGRVTAVTTVRRVGIEEAAEVFEEYERAHPVARFAVRRFFSRVIGERYDGTPAARRHVAERLPVVAFRPVRPASEAPVRP